MKRDESITKEIYEGENVTFPESKKIISCFAAYMEKYCPDFKYSSRYIKSHLEPFKQAIEFNKKFESECDEFRNTLRNNKGINNLLGTIKDSVKTVEFVVEINESILYITKSQSDKELLHKKLANVLSEEMIKKFKLNQDISINISLLLRYEELKIVDYLYDKKVGKDYVELIYGFFNRAFVQILRDRGYFAYINHVVNLRKYIPADYSVVLDFKNEFVFYLEMFDSIENLVKANALVFINDNQNDDIILKLSSEGIDMDYPIVAEDDLDKSLLEFRLLINNKGEDDE